MRLRVEVTAEDIAKGVRNTCDRCPIALALSALGVIEPFVDGYAVEFGNCEEQVRTPEVASAFIEAFDLGNPVEPFTFEIDVPDEAVRS